MGLGKQRERKIVREGEREEERERKGERERTAKKMCKLIVALISHSLTLSLFSFFSLSLFLSLSFSLFLSDWPSRLWAAKAPFKENLPLSSQPLYTFKRFEVVFEKKMPKS